MATSTFGPVEVVALGFPGDRVPETVQEAVLDVLASGVVTLLDLAVVRRDLAGDVEVLELDELGPHVRLTQVELPGAGLAGDEDLDEVAQGIAPGSCAVVLVVEHTWARRVVARTTATGGVVLAREHVPADVVNEVADLALAAG
jgi:uncharacterized membrane protein